MLIPTNEEIREASDVVRGSTGLGGGREVAMTNEAEWPSLTNPDEMKWWSAGYEAAKKDHAITPVSTEQPTLQNPAAAPSVASEDSATQPDWMKADTLFGVYCGGDASKGMPRIDWGGWQRLSDYIAKHSTCPGSEDWMRKAKWVIVSDGEGAEACVIAGQELHQSVHDFMCLCGKLWRECDSDCTWDCEQLDKPDEWTKDEDGNPFSMSWPHETGRITIYKLSAKHYAASQLSTENK